MKDFLFEPTTYKGEARIKVCFKHNTDWNKRMKKVPGVRWSATMQCWHIPDTEANRKKCKLPLQQKTSLAPAGKPLPKKQEFKPISDINQQHLKSLVQLLELKAYSQSTIKTYRNEFSAFLQTLGKTDAGSLSLQRVKDYLQYCHDQLKLSEHSIHSRINALKFFYEQVQKSEKLFWEIPRPKKPLQLPGFFSQEEISAIIKSVQNLKHKTMLMLAYCAGLRISEVIKLKTANIDSTRMCILIEQAKGKKDRIITLSPVLLVMLREYYKKYKPPLKGFFLKGRKKVLPTAAAACKW